MSVIAPMKAMIFAAGFGRRMLPLTESCPKPLLQVAGKALIEYHLEKLASSGIQEVVINVSYLGDKIIQTLGDGSRWGLRIQYSIEDKPLETYGGLMQAYNLLVDAAQSPFLLLNADVFCDVNFSELMARALPKLGQESLGYLLMVENPEHNLGGDFYLNKASGLLQQKDSDDLKSCTFSGVSVLSPKLLTECSAESNKLSDVFRVAMERKALLGECYQGRWVDVGTPERLYKLDASMSV